VPKRASDEVLLAGILLARIERWLEREGVFHVAGFGDVTLAGELDWEPGAGPVYLRRIADGQLWRADISITTRPAQPGEPARTGENLTRSPGRGQSEPAAHPASSHSGRQLGHPREGWSVDNVPMPAGADAHDAVVVAEDEVDGDVPAPAAVIQPALRAIERRYFPQGVADRAYGDRVDVSSLDERLHRGQDPGRLSVPGGTEEAVQDQPLGDDFRASRTPHVGGDVRADRVHGGGGPGAPPAHKDGPRMAP
jgi:hypothetical protein